MTTPNQQPQPLWKVLNEQRTRGKWICDNTQVCSGIEITDETIFDGQPSNEYPTVWERNNLEAKANAAYTALAVNNLSRLAEALEDVTKEYISCLKLLAETTKTVYSENNVVIAAKKAMQAIS